MTEFNPQFDGVKEAIKHMLEAKGLEVLAIERKENKALAKVRDKLGHEMTLEIDLESSEIDPKKYRFIGGELDGKTFSEKELPEFRKEARAPVLPKSALVAFEGTKLPERATLTVEQPNLAAPIRPQSAPAAPNMRRAVEQVQSARIREPIINVMEKKRAVQERARAGAAQPQAASPAPTPVRAGVNQTAQRKRAEQRHQKMPAVLKAVIGAGAGAVAGLGAGLYWAATTPF